MKTPRWPLLVLLLATAPAQAQPAAVDLSRWQTPVKNQWGRGNCFIHGTVAAMEAAYKRAGYGDLDLAELFSDYLGQLFFLETVQLDGRWYTTTMRVPSATGRETSIESDHGMSVESGAPGMVLAIPEEKHMPYRPRPEDLGGHADKNDPFWANQYAVSSYNLDPRFLPFSALSAPRYYQVKTVEWLPKDDARNPAAIEAVLAGGHEVIWDFRLAGDFSGTVWRYAGPAGDAGPHRMLIIGYDRTDPRHPYFLVKNSWGDVGVYNTNDCYTRIEYAYLEYGEWASYVSAIEPPKPWPELQFIGRWNLQLGDRTGTLDIYHLPGMMQKDFDHNQFKDEAGRQLQDRRLGAFYLHDDPSQACRVNGTIRGQAITLYIDFDHPAARWDLLRGWRVDFTLDPRNPHRLQGRFAAPGGGRGEARASRNQKPISPIEPPPAPAREAAPSAPAVTDATPDAMIQRQKEEEILKLEAAEQMTKSAAGDSPIRQKWRELGAEDGFLGLPQTEERVCPDGRGRYIHFAGGSIYWSPESGAHAIYGAIREKWAALGWETCSFLGYPTTDECGTPDGTGRFNHFEKDGSIYWTPAHGACEIHGPIRTEWARQGWETGPLGYPISDMQMTDDKSGWLCRFEHGIIHWDPARGVQTDPVK